MPRPSSSLLALVLGLVAPLALVFGLGCSSGLSSNDDTNGFVSVSNSGADSMTEDGDSSDDSEDTDPTDSGGDPFCGDGICDPVSESCETCQADCDLCPYCGDGTCNGTEDCVTCALDCEVCPGCGDGQCVGPEETCATCPQDCMEGCQEPMCGDGICNGSDDCNNCPGDCGACPPICGDGQCNGSDNCDNCPGDCGECVGCGNGNCDEGESCGSCSQDCGECTCPCSGDPNFDNFCFYGPNTPGCPMTMPGGYCDPNGDGSYDDGDWNAGWFDYAGQCG